jgi:hypothetical protein
MKKQQTLFEALILLFAIFGISDKLNAQLVSDDFFLNRHVNKFEYPLLSNGIDRNVSTTKKWNIALVDYAGSKYPASIQIATSNSLGLADSWAQDYFIGLREWGYSMHHLNNQYDGAGNLIVSGPNFGFNGVPSSPEDALSKINTWFNTQVTNSYSGNTHFITKNGHYFYQHYGASFYPNVDVIACEVGEQIASINAHIAFTRGAARQYGKKMGVDMSSWWVGKIRDYTRQWSKQADAVKNFQIGGTRIAILQTNGTLIIKDGAINSNWITVGQNVSSFSLSGDRIGMINTSGEFYAKEGALSSSWIFINSNVKKIGLNGTRIGYIRNDNSFHVKEGSINTSGWNYMADAVSKFQLEGDRVAILQTDGHIHFKDGTFNSNWIGLYGANATDFQMAADRIIYRTTSGDLKGIDSPVISFPFTTIASSVSDFYLQGNRLGYISNNNELFVKEGSITSTWGSSVVNNAKALIMTSTRVAYVDLNDNLFINDGALNSVYHEMFGYTKAYGLEGNRIVTLWNDGQFFARDGGLMDYQPTVNPFWADGTPKGGHSLSLTKRTFYYAYMSGASLLYPEGGSVNYYNNDNSYQGMFMLSPLGRVGQDIYKFSHNTLDQNNRGIVWAPVGILMNRAHGLGLETWSQNKIFSGMSMDSKDYMNKGLLQSIWGESLVPQNATNESTFLQNNEFGEIFDVLLEDASLDVIKKYPVIILSGDINLDAIMTQKLIDYANAGGNLVVNIEYLNNNTTLRNFVGITNAAQINNQIFDKLKWIPDGITDNVSFQANVKPIWLNSGTEPLMQGGNYAAGINFNLASIRSVGNGKAICIAFPDLMNTTIWEFILRHLTKDKAIRPFIVNGDIQHSYSYANNEWIVTLINNNGVAKTNDNIESINHSFDTSVSLTYQEPDAAITNVYDITGSQNISSSNGVFSVNIPAGDIKVIRVSTVSTKSATIATESSNISDGVLRVYPNPTTNILYLTKMANRVEVYGLTGNLVKSVLNTNVLHLGELDNGLYVLKLFVGEQVLNVKVLKN